METLHNHLQLLINTKFDNNHTFKLSTVLKCYFARACFSVRDPKIIQINHYIDELYANKNDDNNNNVVLSPSKVPLPIAYFVNWMSIKNNGTFFYIDSKGSVQVHPFERIIPCLIALFSSSKLSYSKYRHYELQKQFGGNKSSEGKLFLSSIVLSGAIAMSMEQSGKWSSNVSVCVAITVTIAVIWKLSQPIVAYVLDQFQLNQNDYGTNDVQSCLQAIGVAQCSPNWFTTNYKVSSVTLEIFSFIDQNFAPSNHNFSCLEKLQFCFLDMDPWTSLLAGALYNNSEMAKISVSDKIFSCLNVCRNMINKLSAYINWNRSGSTEISDLLSHYYEEEITCNIEISIQKESTSMITIDTINQEKKEFSLSSLISESRKLHKLLLSKLEWDVSVVLGTENAKELFTNIDLMENIGSVVDAFHQVFERPGLD